MLACQTCISLARGHRRVALWRGACAARAAAPRGADSPTGLCADLADRFDPEGVAMLVDGEKRARQFKDLVSPAQLLGLALEFLPPLGRAGRDPSRTPESTSSRLTHSCRVCGTQPISVQSIRSQPGALHGVPAPSSPRAHGPRVRTCSTSSWLKPLKVLSLHRIRVIQYLDIFKHGLLSTKSPHLGPMVVRFLLLS